MKKIKFGLGLQILVGLILGIIVGAIFEGNPNVETFLKPIGDIFIRLIEMIVVPIVFSSIIVGVANVGDIKHVGRLGGKTILYFEIVTTIAIMFGLVVANLTKPGAGVNIEKLSKVSIQNYVITAGSFQGHSFTDSIVSMVPKNIFEALTNENMLAVIFFAIIFGLGIAAIGEKGKPVLKFFQAVGEAMFWVTNQIMRFAPFGVFALIGITVSNFGLKSMIPLGKLALITYSSMILFVLIVFGIISKLMGTSIFRIIRVLKDELVLTYMTATSATVLQRIMDKMERFGCPKAISSFVIPTGYSFNLDGSTLYQAIAAIFIAQIYGIDLTIIEQINLMVVLMLTSKGIAGVPGVSFVVLLATLGAMGIPLEGLAFVAGIDRILDMARSVVNVLGNSLAVVVVSKWEGKFDKSQEQGYLEEIKKIA